MNTDDAEGAGNEPGENDYDRLYRSTADSGGRRGTSVVRSRRWRRCLT